MVSGGTPGAGKRPGFGVPLLNVMCQMPGEWIEALSDAAEADDLSRADLIRTIVATWLVERDLIAPPSVPARTGDEPRPSPPA